MRRGYELWRELEAEVGERLLHITGSIDAGPEASEVFAGSLASCLEHGLPHTVLDHAELARRFPGYRLPEGHFALYQEEGGFLLSERCIVAQVEAAQARGAEVRARERVLDWSADADGVEVRTDRGRYRAGSLVITAGAWASSLVPGLGERALPERQVLGWFQPSRPERFAPEAFPVFNLLVDEGRYYGFPVYGVPGFKIGLYHHLEEVVEADALDREPTRRDEAVLRDCIARYFPDADGPTMALKACMFTNSPDEHFVIGQHPDHPQVGFAAGFSGHGFKFCSAVGELLADLAIDGTSDRSLELFSPERYLG
jgi:sarcosine oxidase